MAIKFFTNLFDGNASDVLAINTDKVISVFETEKPITKNHVIRIVNIFCDSETTFQVKGKIEDIVAQLNQKD